MRMIERPLTLMRVAIMKWFDDNKINHMILFSNLKKFDPKKGEIRSMVFSALYHEFGLNHTEIAEIFNLSQPTVSRYLLMADNYYIDSEYKCMYESLVKYIIYRFERAKNVRA